MYKNILVPTDGSPLSDKAIKEAAMLALENGAKVTLFHTVAPYDTPIYAEGMAIPRVPRQRAARAAADKARRVLAAAQKKAKAAGADAVKEYAIAFSARDAIVALAQRRRCDLIVMASHGRRALSSLVLGSQTQGVLSRTKVPVLVVR